MAPRLVPVVAYVRVSTDRQAERGLGLDVQRQAISKWARSGGYRVVQWFADEGISGSNGIDTRLGLHDALAALKSGPAKGLVVYRLDRLARDLVLQEQLLAEVRRMGAVLHSTSAGEAGYLADDPDDPSRALIRQVLGAVSQYERSMIRLRLAAGRRRKGERGGFAYGQPPLGFRSVGGVLVADDEAQATVARIRELHGEGRSLRGIVAVLEAEGHKTKRGGTWAPNTVAKVLARV